MIQQPYLTACDLCELLLLLLVMMTPLYGHSTAQLLRCQQAVVGIQVSKMVRLCTQQHVFLLLSCSIIVRAACASKQPLLKSTLNAV